MKNQDIKKLIVLGTVLGIGYLGYSYYFQDRSCLTLNQTRQIAQEIKHQMLGVTIIFCQKSSQTLQKLRKQNKGEDAQLVQFYTAKIGQFYKQKQSIILDKQNVSLEKYQRSLKAHEKDEKLSKILLDILQMMSKSANGEVPDLTVDKRAINKFGKPQVKKIYQDMTKMILVSVLGRLKQQQKVNNSFDPSIDRQFKRVIKGINMFSKKTQFFKQRGVSQQWGHPNQVFLKLTQSYKISDDQFRSEMEVLQTLFDKILIDITKDLQNYTINKIYTQFAQAQQKNKNQILSRSAYQPQIFQNEQIQLNINKSTRSQPQPQGHQQFQQHNRQDLSDQFFDENSVSKIK